MHKLALISIIFIITNVHFSLASEISHPPSFEQIKQSFKNGEKFNTDLSEALKYSYDDIELLKRKDNINYIIGIAYQLNRSEATNLLISYLPEVKTNYLCLSLLISCALQEEKLSKELPVEKLSEELIKQSPNNGYAYYLMAYYYAKTNNFDKCINFTKKAVNTTSFNNHWTDFSDNSISTSILIGYPKLAAQIHALGLQHDIFVYYKLAEYILNNATSETDIVLCKDMGTVIKKNSTTVLGDYMSIAIQKKSLEKLKKYSNTAKELCSIEELKGILKPLLAH